MLSLLWDGEYRSSEVARHCQLSRPATSQHLKVLRDAGLVGVRSEGTRRLYRVRAERLRDLRTTLDQFWGDKLSRLQAPLESRDANEGDG